MEQMTDWKTLCFIGENLLSDMCLPYVITYDYVGNMVAQDFELLNKTKIEDYEFTHFEGSKEFIKSVLSYPASWMRCVFHMIHPKNIEEVFSTQFNVRRFEIQINTIEISTIVEGGLMGGGLIGLARLLFSKSSILRTLQNWEHVPIEQGAQLETKIMGEDTKMQRYQTILSGHALFIKCTKIAMTFEPTINIVPQENVKFGSYHVVGKLVQVPFPHHGEHYSRILASDTKKTLIITPYTNEIEDGLVINGWEDFERFTYRCASKVYVSKHFWESASYKHYVRHVSFGINYFPSRVKASSDKFIDPKTFFDSMATVHSAYYSTFTGMELGGYESVCSEMPCCPFECVTWDRVVISDTKGILADSIYPFSRVSSAIWLFTTNFPYPSTQEYKMMDCLLRIGNNGTSCVPLSTLLHYCFIQSKGVGTIVPSIDYELVHMSPVERYLFRRHRPETLLYQQRLIEGAESAVRSNPLSHFCCMTFQDMLHDLRVRSAEDRKRMVLELEIISKDHDEAVSMLEKWAAIPEDTSEEIQEEEQIHPHAQTIHRIVQTALASQGIQAGEMVILGRSVLPQNEAPPFEDIGTESVEEEEGDSDEDYEDADEAEEDADEAEEDADAENMYEPESSAPPVAPQSRIDVMSQHQQAVNRTTLRSMIQRYEALRTESLTKKQELEKRIEDTRLESAELEGKLKTIQNDFHDHECSVCYDSNAEVLTTCLHAFCAKCMWKIFIRKNMIAPCPYCKESIKPNDIYFIIDKRVNPQIPIYSKYKTIAHRADEYTSNETCRTLVIVRDPYTFYTSFHYLNLRNKIVIWDPRLSDSASQTFVQLTLSDDPCVIVTNVNHVDLLPRVQNLNYVLCDHYISSNSHKFSYLRQHNPDTRRLPHYVSFLQNETKESLLIPVERDVNDE